MAVLTQLNYIPQNTNMCTDSQINLIKKDLIQQLNDGKLIHKELNKKNNEKDKLIELEKKYHEITLINDDIKRIYLPQIIYKNGLLPYINRTKKISYKDIEYFELMISCFISGSNDRYIEEHIEDSVYLSKITSFFHKFNIETIKNNERFFKLFFSSFSISNIKEIINTIEINQNKEDENFNKIINNNPSIHTIIMNSHMNTNRKYLSEEAFLLLKKFCTESEVKLKVSTF